MLHFSYITFLYNIRLKNLIILLKSKKRKQKIRLLVTTFLKFKVFHVKFRKIVIYEYSHKIKMVKNIHITFSLILQKQFGIMRNIVINKLWLFIFLEFMELRKMRGKYSFNLYIYNFMKVFFSYNLLSRVGLDSKFGWYQSTEC